MNTAENQPINVDLGVMVMIPIARYEALKNVEADKERYAQHILEHQKNLTAADTKIKELSQGGDNYREKYYALEKEYTTLREQNNLLALGGKVPASAKKVDVKKAAPAKKSSPKKK